MESKEELESMTDSQIIREIKDGNVELFAELMNRYQRKLLSFIFHMLKSLPVGIACRGFMCRDVLQGISEPEYVPRGRGLFFDLAIYDCP